MTSRPETPAVGDRADLVRRDLDNVIHPIVPHRQLEERQLVITTAKDSTVVDADGREYLDGMAGLWCVNIGYGRTELADVASQQMRALVLPTHRDERPRRCARREGQRPPRRRQPRLPRQLGLGGERGGVKFARQYADARAPGQPRYKSISRYSAITARRWPRWPRAAWATAR